MLPWVTAYIDFYFDNLFYWTIVNPFETVLLQSEILKCDVKNLPHERFDISEGYTSKSLFSSCSSKVIISFLFQRGISISKG